MAAKPLVFFDNLGELADTCVFFYEENREKMSLDRVRENRVKLSSFVEVFHKDCGTLSPSIERRIEDLKSGISLVLMTAHQPNLFGYSGVFRKATLNFVLAKRLEEKLKVPVVNFFGIADQDFTDDRWVRSCQIPAVQRSGGVLTIDVKLPEKLMIKAANKPSSELIGKWRIDIEGWFGEAIRSVERLFEASNLRKMQGCYTSDLNENLECLWDIVEDCYNRSEKYSDFNAFMMSKIVNDTWGYDTVFARFSDCQQIFGEEFGYLLSHNDDYSRLLVEAKRMPRDGRSFSLSDGHDVSGVTDEEPWLVPFWYHCVCGSKVKLFLSVENESLFGHGTCIRCGGQSRLELGPRNDPDISNIISQISARALPMILVFFKGLMPSGYVGGVGGIRYLMEGAHVAKGLGVPFPPVAFWRPHDKYMGIAQMEAVLELNRICAHLGVRCLSAAKNLLESRMSEIRECLDKVEESRKRILEKSKKYPSDLKLKERLKSISRNRTMIVKSSNLSIIAHELRTLENVTKALDLMPSIIDYAVNIGLRETSDQWIRYLDENGRMFLTTVHLRSILDENALAFTNIEELKA